MVVVGGGMAGLATALFSARCGHEATVIDRDPGPPEGDALTLGGWERPGVAQANFAHGFPARSGRVIREQAPDLLPALAAAGIGTTDTRFGPGYEDDRVSTARRPIYEAVLRRLVARQHGVTLVQGSVVGLVAAPSDDRIVGVRVRGGDVVDGDLVVDAGGRRSSSTRWLRELGLREPPTEDHPCGLHYLSRDYRLRDGEEYPRNDAVFAAQPYLNTFTFVGDNRTFSVAMAVSSRDPLRARLHDPDVYQRLLQAIPPMRDWIARAQPISDVRIMAGLSNRRRRVVVDHGPLVAGLALVGDSALYTNPTLGQGISLSFWMAQTLTGRLEQAATDPIAAVAEYEAWVDRQLGPLFTRQIEADRRMRRQLDAGVGGAGFLPPDDEQGRYLQALGRLATRDEAVGHTVLRVANLLEPPSAYSRPEIRSAVQTMLEDGPPEPPPVSLPRAGFERLVSRGSPGTGSREVTSS